MILNDATLLSKKIDGVECSTMREFVSKLVKTEDLSMKVYINSKLICAGPACLNVDNNWIIASITVLVSYTDTVITDSIIVRIMQGDVTLFESVTPCNAIIPAKDTVATFYVCLTSNTPYNELSKRVPHSVFRSRPIAKLTPVEFDKITDGLNPGGVISVPTVTRVNVWPLPLDTYVFNVVFDSLSDVGSIAYTINYEHVPVSVGTGSSNPYDNNNIYFSVPAEGMPDMMELIEHPCCYADDILTLDLEIHDLHDNPVDTLTLSRTDGAPGWFWFHSAPEDG